MLSVGFDTSDPFEASEVVVEGDNCGAVLKGERGKMRVVRQISSAEPDENGTQIDEMRR